jgi:hypothetical protein
VSLIKAIKQQLGLSVTPANNFTLDASADNGTMKLSRNSGEDIMTVDAAGKVAFPQMGQSLGAVGYVKLPGGAVIAWGSGTSDTSGASIGSFGGVFTQTPRVAFSAVASGLDVLITVNSLDNNNFSLRVRNMPSGSAANVAYTYVAMGY